MTAWLVLGLCVMLLLFSAYGSGGVCRSTITNKSGWGAIMLALLVALASPNPWMALLIAVHGLGFLFLCNADPVLYRNMYPGIAYAAAWLLLAGILQRWMVEPILWALAAVALLGSVWTLWAIAVPWTEERQLDEMLCWPVSMQEASSKYPRVSQGNFNPGQCLLALGIAAAAGLGIMGRWAALAIIPACLLAMRYAQHHDRPGGPGISQGILHVSVMLVGWTWLVNRTIGDVLAAVALVGLLWYARPWEPRGDWHDSGRFAAWKIAVEEIWWPAAHVPDLVTRLESQQAQMRRVMDKLLLPENKDNLALHVFLEQFKGDVKDTDDQLRYVCGMPMTDSDRQRAKAALAMRDWLVRWRVRLFGFGTGSWYAFTAPFLGSRAAKIELTAAHNEYVQQLVEHGLVGLLLLLAFITDGLWRTAAADPSGQAVFLVGLTLCSIAATTFPWTHAFEFPTSTQLETYGAPVLVAVSLIIAALAQLY